MKKTPVTRSNHRAESAAPLPAASGNWRAALEATVTGLNYDVVNVQWVGQSTLQVTIDRIPGQFYLTGEADYVLVEDCEQVTRQLQYVLEVEGLNYGRLEVSSPGLDRPLNKAADFARFVGEEIKITLRQPFQGRKKYQGQLFAPEGAAEHQWALLLEAKQPKAGVAANKAGGKKRKQSNAKARQADPSDAVVVAGSALGAAEVADLDVVVDEAMNSVLQFELSELQSAALVPQLNFRGADR